MLEAIGAFLFFADLLIFHLASKSKANAAVLWWIFGVINVLGLLIIVFGGTK